MLGEYANSVHRNSQTMNKNIYLVFRFLVIVVVALLVGTISADILPVQPAYNSGTSCSKISGGRSISTQLDQNEMPFCNGDFIVDGFLYANNADGSTSQ